MQKNQIVRHCDLPIHYSLYLNQHLLMQMNEHVGKWWIMEPLHAYSIHMLAWGTWQPQTFTEHLGRERKCECTTLLPEKLPGYLQEWQRGGIYCANSPSLSPLSMKLVLECCWLCQRRVCVATSFVWLLLQMIRWLHGGRGNGQHILSLIV